MPINKSTVIGGKERKALQLPYQLRGEWGSIFDAVTIPAVSVKIKLRGDGVKYAVIINHFEEPVVLTPRRMLCFVTADLLKVIDKDGKSVRIEKQRRVNTLADRAVDVLKNLELGFPAVFKPSSNVTPAMRKLTIGVQDLEVRRPLTWGSSAVWQPMSLVEESQLAGEVNNLQQGRVIAEMAVGEKRFYSQALAIPKVDKKSVQLTFDCRQINTYFKPWLSPLMLIADMLSKVPADWQLFSVVDVKDRFFNIPLAVDLQLYLCFAANDRCYKFQRLAQGFNGSACLFHSLLGRMLQGLGDIY